MTDADLMLWAHEAGQITFYSEAQFDSEVAVVQAQRVLDLIALIDNPSPQPEERQ